MTESNSFSFFLPLGKVDKERRMVSGYASTPAIDLDGEIVSLDAVKKALPGYWQWRNIREMHSTSAVGVAKEAAVDDKGLFLSAKIVDDVAWQKCLEGVYKGFSIGGRKINKSGNTITEIELIEISVVDRPANPECRIEVQKSAKDADGNGAAVLTKLPKSFRDPQSRALGKMAGAIRVLAKAGPPAAKDGFSLPAPAPIAKAGAKCEEHGIEDCPDCVEKREFTGKERKADASSGAALPDGSFPIENEKDLSNAIQAVGRAKNKAAAKEHIVSRARVLGATSALPEKWGKKAAKKAAKAAAKAAEKAQKSAAVATASASSSATHSAPAPAFLTLSADGGAEATGSQVKCSHELDLGHSGPMPRTLAKGEKIFSKRQRKLLLSLISGEDTSMTEQNVDLEKMVTGLLLKAVSGKADMTPGQRIAAAQGNVKKARKAAKGMESAIKAAHGMHKAAYLAKAAKKDAKPDADGDFDHEAAMEKLSKAFNDAQALKTFMKAAGVQLKKAASRVGQTEQEVGTGNAHYEVPGGVRSLSQNDLLTAGPGGEERGTIAPEHLLDSGPFPGKTARKAAYSAAEVEALLRAERAEATVDILKNAPSGGRRPLAFDLNKALGGEANAPGGLDASLFKGVNLRDIQSEDENKRKAAVGGVIGNMITSGHGRSIMDPTFHGTAGGGTA